MSEVKKVVLVGPMGAGKSTIGRLLAKQLNFPFKDSDHVIEENAGADIPWIFDVEGEEGFRSRETSVIQALLQDASIVLATGGGAVLRPKNRQLLQDAADAIVYLVADPEYLLHRTAKDKKRPLLQVDNPREKIIQLLEERDPLYREVATHIVPTDTRSPKWVVQNILAQLGFC